MRKIILDCDPGLDDAIALFLAEGHDAIDLVAVTTVFGNQTVDKVTTNARRLAAVAGIRAPIARGSDRPLLRTASHAPHIHGESGLGDVILPTLQKPLDPRHAVDLIIDVVMAADPGEITLVPTGALTNIALAARLQPQIIPRVREVVLMGGSCHVGNQSAVAEFNIAADPEAASIVFDAGWPVVMVGLDLTHQALATPEVQSAIRFLNGEASRAASAMLDSFTASYSTATGRPDPPVHDPCAVAYVIDSGIVATRRVPIHVELSGTHTAGMTVVDFRQSASAESSTSVATHLDADRFWDEVYNALANLSARGATIAEKESAI